ncbi:hypothetical protein CKA32_003084 [Geitlerinema sp. FC II]|nr:hypothetical protein CKA32_003084 [Geitlerinema sp. FC II]
MSGSMGAIALISIPAWAVSDLSGSLVTGSRDSIDETAGRS